MKVSNSFRYLAFGLVINFLTLIAIAQTPVQISKDKVSIDGTAYYIHIVKQGQTLYSISKAYNVSTEVLFKENSSAVYGLKEGDPLKIPILQVIQDNPVTREKDNEKYIYHTLREGETVFALSRKYNIPEDQIKESNSGINIYDIPIGTEIAIPRKSFREETVYFRTDEQGFILHKVSKGESLADIARKYDLTVRKLRNANHRVIFPKVGEYLRVPSDDTAVALDTSEDIIEVDTALIDDENLIRLFDGTEVNYTSLDGLDGKIDVALMLPLYLKENSSRSYIDSSEYNQYGKKRYKVIKRPEEWIYAGSERFIEYYEGVLLAVNNLRSLGLSIDLKVFDTEGDSLVVDNLLREGSLRNADLILGPVYSYNVDLVGKYARRSRIPVVSPLASRNTSILRSNPYLFKVKPGIDVVEEAMAKEISDYYDYNLIFVHSDTAWSENLSSDFKSNIIRKLRYVTPLSEVDFREVFFKSRSAYNDTINIIDHAMSKDKPNLVIVASTDESVMEDVLITVHSLLKDYDIKVFGYPEMLDLPNLDPIYLFDLNVMMFTTSWVDYEQDDVKDFIKDFRTKFNMEPHIGSFAWQSYDISYYFISGIALHGSRFMYYPRSHRPDLLQTDYEFFRKGITSGFENNKLFLIQYTPEMRIKFPDIRMQDYRE